jgi:RHS repeat-associated protein
MDLMLRERISAASSRPTRSLASGGTVAVLGSLASTESAQYTYDALEQRVEKTGGSGPGEFIYFNGVPIAVLSGGSWTDLIWAGKSMIAEIPDSTEGAEPVYRLLDNEGSLVGLADSSGTMTGPVVYAPYGQVMSNSITDSFGYAGLYQDTEYGGDHAGYRSLSTEQIRWLSPDPYNGSYNLMDPQSLNRYSYVSNNPLALVDPTGEAGAGVATGIGGNVCLGYTFDNVNPCNPVPSAVSLWLFGPKNYVPYLSFITTFACGFASSSDAKSTFCGQSGLTGLFSKDHPDLATGINDAVAATQLADSLALSAAADAANESSFTYLMSCVSGPSNPVCDVAIALIVYSAINDIISFIEDFFGEPRFSGSLLPRPSGLGGLGAAPIGLPNQNLSVPSLLGQAPRSVVPSPEPLFSLTKK